MDSPGRRGVRAGEGCVRTRGGRPWGQALPMRPEEWGRASTPPWPAFLRSVTFWGVLPAPHQQVSGLTELQVPPQDRVQCGLSHHPPVSPLPGGTLGPGGAAPVPEAGRGVSPAFPRLRVVGVAPGCGMDTPALAPRFPRVRGGNRDERDPSSCPSMSRKGGSRGQRGGPTSYRTAWG